MHEHVHAWFGALSPGEQVEVRAAAAEVPMWMTNSLAEHDITALELAEYLRDRVTDGQA